MEALSHIIFELEMVGGRGCLPFFVRLPVASIILGSIPGPENLNGPQPAKTHQ
jgi:hypothetical protein